MRLDALLAMVPVGAPLSLVGVASGAGLPSLNTIDLVGAGVGQPPGVIIGNAATFGEDPGVGSHLVEMECVIGTACAGSATGMNAAIQYAADTGVAGGYQPSTWYTAADVTTPIANLTAGSKFCRLPWLPATPPNLRPRYVRMLFTPVGGTFTAGTIAWALPTPSRDDQAQRLAAKNYTVL